MSVIHSSRGTTFIRCCLTAPTSSSTYILQPANGGIRPRSTLARSDFFSQLRAFFHGWLTYGLSTNRPLSGCNLEPLLVPSMLFCYKVFRCAIATIRRANKKALHPSFREGQRAKYTALVVPPSFVAASRHQPRRVLTYSSPLTGASGQGLLSHEAISSRDSGLFLQCIDIWAFHQPPTLWTQR